MPNRRRLVSALSGPHQHALASALKRDLLTVKRVLTLNPNTCEGASVIDFAYLPFQTLFKIEGCYRQGLPLPGVVSKYQDFLADIHFVQSAKKYEYTSERHFSY